MIFSAESFQNLLNLFTTFTKELNYFTRQESGFPYKAAVTIATYNKLRCMKQVFIKIHFALIMLHKFFQTATLIVLRSFVKARSVVFLINLQ